MNPSYLDLPYRLRRRVARELRQRARGLDRIWDRWNYRRTVRGSCSRDLLLVWTSTAGDPTIMHDSEWGSPAEITAVVAAAERACAHEFDLLGSGPTALGVRIDWHRDFKSGHRWDPALHHSKIRWDDLPEGVDVKVPWELSRCQHFAALGLADRLGGNAGYYAEWKVQTRDWIAANPVGRGVNWSCAMDVGMRAVNWLNAAILFKPRIETDDDPAFFELLAESLWHHGLHIERNLEWSGPRCLLAGNHFLADLTGLLAIGGLFRMTGPGRRWWRFARQWVEHEMTRQVNPDGTNYETSTSYHRMVMEMFLWADTLATRLGDPFPAAYRQRLDRMADFVAAYSAPGGFAAQFGDNDSGRLLVAGVDDGSDHRYLVRGDCGFGGKMNRLLLRGTAALPGGAGSAPSAFRDGGFYFLKKGIAWAGLRAGPVSHGGAHAHCDQLSLVFNLAGRDILVDRGTGVYTPDPAKRNHYRATGSHNTFQINRWEQNGFGAGKADVFRMPDHVRSRVIRHEDAGPVGLWEAEHRGYERYREGLICRRAVRLSDTSLEIEDSFAGPEPEDQLEWYFHFAPGLACEAGAESAMITVDGFQLRLAWRFLATARVEAVSHSPAYGVERPARALMIVAKAAECPASCCFSLTWSAAR